MQAVNISTESDAFIGTSTVVKNTFNLPEDTTIFWAGSRIYAKRPCNRDIIVSKIDIFCEGTLEKGEYIREKSIPLSSRIPPSTEERNIAYRIRTEISMVKPGTRAEEEYFFAEKPIILKARPPKTGKFNPVEVSIKGIKIHMDKDHFQPGETINIDYELESFKDLQVELIKNANLSCRCPDYAPSCIHIKPIPPSVEKTVKASNLTTGTLQIPLPPSIELSHRYIWEPPEKTHWKETYGDHVNWVLKITGINTSGEIVEFQIPIIIYRKQTPEESELFTSKQAPRPILQKILVPDLIQIVSHNKNNKRLSVSFKNNSKEILTGVTVKIIPIESEFFELPPFLTGLNKWEPGTEIKAFHNNVGTNIKNFQILIEDNHGNSISKRLKIQ